MGEASPAGWYPDPAGKYTQRYFDGATWTESYAPYPQQNHPVVVQGQGQGIHLVLTLLTCGAWLPIWFIIAIIGARRQVVINK